MRKKFTIFSCIFGLLAGCAEYSGSSEKSISNNVESNDCTANFVIENMLHLSFDDNYFMEKGQKFRIISASKKELAAGSSKSQQSDIVYGKIDRNKCASEKLESDEKRAYVKCCYLGNLNGKHVIMRSYNSGGSGTFTDIVQCLIEKENLYIQNVSMLGDRALDGIVGYPRLGSNGDLYLKMRPSISTVASLAGVPNKDIETGPFQGAEDFWNVSECIYNLNTGKLEIISMEIDFENSSDVTKILEEVFPNHEKTIRIEKNGMPEFLNKFKSAYLKFARKTARRLNLY